MSRSLRSKALLILVLPAAFLAAGCRETPSVSAIRWQIERHTPGLRLERESHIRLGRLTFGALKRLALWAMEEDDEGRRILPHIRRVDVATYRVLALPEAAPLASYRFEEKLAADGWEMLVRERGGKEQTWVFYRPGGAGSIRNLYLVALDADELTVVELEGRLDRLFAQALADDPEGLFEVLGA